MNLFPSCLNRLCLCILVGCLLCGRSEAEAATESFFGTGLPASEPRIAIFPIENLSGMPAPLRELTAELSAVVKMSGARIIEPGIVENFIEKHRIRYLGGIDETTAAALKIELDADAVLVSTLELYIESSPPKFSLMSRLVNVRGVPEIIWMDGVGISGDDAPGILGLGLIDDLKVLRGKGFKSIGASLTHYIAVPPVRKKRISARIKRAERPFTLKELIKSILNERPLLTAPPVRRSFLAEKPPDKEYTVEDMLQEMEANGGAFLSRYSPLNWYSSQDTLVDQERTIGIIPFFNRSTRKHAAELQVLHLAKQLVSDGNFRVLELGVIRDKMLNMHVVMKDGISIPNIDLISISLGVDMLLNGVVFDYLDTVGSGFYPKIDFSTQLFDRDTKKILWSSHSHNQGDDGVYFFEYRRIATAGALADRMCRALVLKFVDNAKHEKVN